MSIGTAEVEVGASRTERIVNSDGFYTTPVTKSGRDFFIFQRYGDYLKGKLLSKNSNHHINRTCSYRIAVEAVRQGGKDIPVCENQVEEFFTNRQLQQIVKDCELVGSIVRIVYIGRQKSRFGGHSAKVYQVFREKGYFSSQEETQNAKPRRRTKSKHATNRPGRSSWPAASRVKSRAS